jgi:uncharacterized protein YjiS (DUF1127 family)
MLTTFVLTKIRSRLVYRDTVRELDSLSDRELSDLGIGRSDIENTARQATR